MNQAFKEFKLHKAVTAAILATSLGTAGVAGGLASAAASPKASGPTLVMESSQESAVPQNFNPFDSGSAGATLGANSLVYEPLIQFDAANTRRVYPWLATAWTWGPGGRSLKFTIRRGVKWNNGKPLTASDVAFTYELLVKHGNLNNGGIPLRSVSTSGDTVTLNFSEPAYTALQSIGSVYIVPQSVWQNISDPSTYIDLNPVGSGPYELSNYSTAGIALKANPHYWQKIGIQTVDLPFYTSGPAAENALLTGQATWEGNFITGLQKSFLDTSSNHIAWFAPVNTNSFFPNLHKFPTDMLPVRKAISLAINRTQIGAIGESGLEAPAYNASGLTLPVFGQYLTPAAKKLKLNTKPERVAAMRVLERAGWRKHGKYFYKGGKQLKLQISDPANYSDYALDDQLAARQLQAIGINATFNGMSDNGWYAALPVGGFQLTQHWSQTSANPYNLYDNWLNSAVPSSAGNFEGLHNPAVDRMLSKVASAPSISAERADLLPIERFVAGVLPVIPTVYGASFMEANTSQIVGWPSAKNPYESGSPNSPTNEVVVLHLHPAH